MFFDPSQEVFLFARLSTAFKARLKMQDRDRALIITGVCAAMLKMDVIANFCQQLILQNNPGHMVRKYDSFTAALETEDFTTFLKQVRRKLPTEKAEVLLNELDHQCDVRPEDYDDENAYVAALMGMDFEWLKENFS